MEIKTRNSKPRKDISGQQFGYLTPIYYIKGGKWHCKCKCGNECDVDTRNLNSGHTTSCGCKNYETKNIKDMTGFENDGIKVLEFVGTDNQQTALWKCECKYCHNIFTTRGSSIRAGYINSCGCVHSFQEQNITKLFIENNIEFATQYTFSDLKDIKNLRFDFAVFKDYKLSHLIEYNGQQHYIQTSGSWGEDFQILQKHDEMKKQYCEEHNIPLLIITGKDYTLSDLLI